MCHRAEKLWFSDTSIPIITFLLHCASLFSSSRVGSRRYCVHNPLLQNLLPPLISHRHPSCVAESSQKILLHLPFGIPLYVVFTIYKLLDDFKDFFANPNKIFFATSPEMRSKESVGCF